MGAGLLHRVHRGDLHRHRRARALHVGVGIRRAQLGRLLERHALRDVADQRIVRRGLIGDEIRGHAALHELGVDVGCIADDRDRSRELLLHALVDPA